MKEEKRAASRPYCPSGSFDHLHRRRHFAPRLYAMPAIVVFLIALFVAFLQNRHLNLARKCT